MKHRYMQAVVIGGAANGMIIQKLRTDAERISLSRPAYLKPLAYSKQEQPEAAMLEDEYRVATMFLDAGGPDPVPFGLVMVDGMTVVEAYSELVKGFAENAINKIAAEQLKQ